MNIVPLTLAISLCLVFTFILFFLLEHSEHRVSSAEHDSLLPLADELPRIPAEARATEAHDHHDTCGCRDGSRPPCPGCLKHRA
jgi:ABC-type nickel/cobalt efflux system permease component RcnA